MKRERMEELMLCLAAGFGMLAAALCAFGSGTTVWENVNRPLALLGEGLRALSLSGMAGNLGAWVFAVLLCGVPLLLHGRSRAWKRTDSLLILAVPVLFAMVYFAVNPTLLSALAAAVFPVAALCTALSLVVCWGIVQWLGHLEGLPAERLAGMFRVLLVLCGGLWTFEAVWGDSLVLRERIMAVLEGNDPLTDTARGTLLWLGVLFLLRLVPELLAAHTLIWSARLAGSLGRERFDEEVVALCDQTAKRCRWIALTTVGLTVVANLLQLLLLDRLHDSSFLVEVPLFPLALSAGLFLLCRCLQRGRVLQEDADSII